MSTPNPILQREPEAFAAGDQVKWMRQIDDYAPPTWTLKYVLLSPTNIYKFDATNDAGNFLITLDSATTRDWRPGKYAMGAYVTDGTNQKEVFTYFRTLTIGANLASKPEGIDVISFAAKMVPIIEETIAKLSNRTVATASVNGQMYSIANLSDLFMLRERFKSEVRREEEQARLNAGLGASNNLAVRFRPMSAAGYPWFPRPPWN